TTIVERTTQARSRSSTFSYSNCRRTPRMESPRRKSRSSTGRRNASEFFCAVLSFVDIRGLLRKHQPACRLIEECRLIEDGALLMALGNQHRAWAAAGPFTVSSAYHYAGRGSLRQT